MAIRLGSVTGRSGMLGRVTTRLDSTTITLPVAPLGAENPLPPLRPPSELHEVTSFSARLADELPPDLAANIRYGGLHSLLPCLVQDGYARARELAELPAFALDNGRVRATVLPSYGGRLWSLEVDGRELLYRNPVVQPANLALRNAWLAGGVEWNLGSTGHWTGTCEPLHAATVEGPDGTPVLRLWEWERTRNLVVQLDFWLPAESTMLYVGVRIRNPHPYEVPAYWWSNIAVPQSPGGRVLAPASHAWHFGYTKTLDLVDVSDPDVSYPMRHTQAADYFFELPADQRPWIAAVSESGEGLVQLSTSRLRGRKLFVWGTGRGGRRWQEWLAPGAGENGYTEIQAGLARTQLEHLPLPAATTWDWLEAYGPVTVPDAFGSWSSAIESGGRAVEALLPADELAPRHHQWLSIADAEPSERLSDGSGWGALEFARLKSAGTPIALPGTPFDVLTPRQQPWLALLDGAMPAGSEDAPDGTLVGPWRALLEEAPDDWLVLYHRGVARWHDGDLAGARSAWQESLAHRETVWALRNLAVVADDPSEAVSLYSRALELAPELRPLVVEALTFFIRSNLYAEAAALLSRLGELRQDGQVMLAEVEVLLWQGDAKTAEALLDKGIELPGIREGANRLAELWREVGAALGTDRPVPDQYDFTMF